MSYPVTRISVTPADRYPTAELWKGVLDAFGGEQSVYNIFDDFVLAQLHAEDAVVDNWLLSDAAAGGTATAPTDGTPEGVKTITDAGGTAHFGGSLLRASGGTAVANIPLPSHTTTPRGRVTFEALVDSAAGNVEFIGLTDTGVDFLSSSSALGDKNYIGFFKGESGDLTFVTSDTAVGTQVTDSVTVLAAAAIPTGQYKVGFAVNPDLTVEIFVDGVNYRALAATINPAALPTASLLPRIEATAGANTGAVAYPIDWVKINVAK